jgi:putative N-acetylmannosamine-6-phosphate epimerase
VPSEVGRPERYLPVPIILALDSSSRPRKSQPDHTTLSMGNDPGGLIMSDARYATSIDNREDASFDFHGGVSRLIE